MQLCKSIQNKIIIKNTLNTLCWEIDPETELLEMKQKLYYYF